MSEAAVQACLPDSDSAVDFEQASEEELREMREIRGHAALLAMLGMTLMEAYYNALPQSMIRRVHAAAWRPRKAGGADPSADAMVPAISRLLFRSLSLQLLLPLLWLIGVGCGFSVLFDHFEAGSTQEWLASASATLMMPTIVFIGASLNAQTVRELLKGFLTLYVLVNALGFTCLILFLFRDNPAKMVAAGLAIPSYMLAGFIDAYVEGGRGYTSRVFFTLNVAGYVIYLALVSLKLGAFTDYTFEFSVFAFTASSMVCSTLTTMLVFGCKNLGLSFVRPGSLVVLTSSVCCLFLDDDTLAVLKAAYSLQNQTLGKRQHNKTVERQLKKHKKSIMEAAGALLLGASGVAPAPTAERYTNEPREGGTPQPAAFRPHVVVVEDAGGVDAVADFALGSGAGGCAPFDMRAGPEKSRC
jgi:hypothetical protein